MSYSIELAGDGYGYAPRIVEPRHKSRFSAVAFGRVAQYDSPLLRCCALCGRELEMCNEPENEDYRRDRRLDGDDHDMCPCGEP
jgi:hypothetical protein